MKFRYFLDTLKFNVVIMEVGDKYICKKCGNEVTVSKVGGGTLVCCGQPMNKAN